LRLCPKILQDHILCVHFGFVQLQLMMPHLPAMYHDKDLFLMSWPLHWTTIKLHVLICNGHLFCINTPPIAISFAPVCTSICF
jgi:hypothetical protein